MPSLPTSSGRYLRTWTSVIVSEGSSRFLPSEMPFPTALDPFMCNRYEIAEFARAAHAAGVGYLGLCCGGAPHHIRSLAEALGRTPPASRYSPDMSKHAYFGTDATLRKENLAFGREL